MKYLFFILFLPLNLPAQSLSQYLVKQNNDTIVYHGDLIVNDERISHWKNIMADSIEYDINKIKAAYFNQQLYYNCDGKHLYKQVINGKIKVYALNDQDTIGDARGNLKRKIFIQSDLHTKPLLYTIKNLSSLVTQNNDIKSALMRRNSKRNGGRAMVISGIAIGAPTIVISLFGALISAILYDDEGANHFLVAAATGFTIGGGLIGGGISMKAGTKKLNLAIIHEYNSAN